MTHTFQKGGAKGRLTVHSHRIIANHSPLKHKSYLRRIFWLLFRWKRERGVVITRLAKTKNHEEQIWCMLLTHRLWATLKIFVSWHRRLIGHQRHLKTRESQLEREEVTLKVESVLSVQILFPVPVWNCNFILSCLRYAHFMWSANGN